MRASPLEVIGQTRALRIRRTAEDSPACATRGESWFTESAFGFVHLAETVDSDARKMVQVMSAFRARQDPVIYEGRHSELQPGPMHPSRLTKYGTCVHSAPCRTNPTQRLTAVLRLLPRRHAIGSTFSPRGDLTRRLFCAEPRLRAGYSPSGGSIVPDRVRAEVTALLPARASGWSRIAPVPHLQHEPRRYA